MKTAISTPKISNKFDVLSLYYDGRYYFPQDIKESNKRPLKPFEIQVVYYTYKWFQDTFYITEDFKNFILQKTKSLENEK